jgi:hypothetical protein
LNGNTRPTPGAPGSYEARWPDIGTGEWGKTETLQGGRTVTISAPAAGHWAATILRTGSTGTGQQASGPLRGHPANPRYFAAAGRGGTKRASLTSGSELRFTREGRLSNLTAALKSEFPAAGSVGKRSRHAGSSIRMRICHFCGSWS